MAFGVSQPETLNRLNIGYDSTACSGPRRTSPPLRPNRPVAAPGRAFSVTIIREHDDRGAAPLPGSAWTFALNFAVSSTRAAAVQGGIHTLIFMAEPTRTLFRAEALGRAASPDDLERLMPLTGSKDWVLIVVTGALLSLAVLWSFVGRVPTIVAGRGIILRPEQVKPVQTTMAGRLLSVNVRRGDRVRQGDLVATLDQADVLKRIDENRQYLKRLEDQDRLQRTAEVRQLALQSRQDALEKAGLESERATLRSGVAGGERLRSVLAARAAATQRLVAAGLLGPAASEVSEVELAIRENAAKIEEYSSGLSRIDGRLQSIDTRHDTLAKLILDASLSRRNEIAQVRRSIELDAFQVGQDGSIRSQYAGTVAEVVAAAGQVVPAGGRVLTLDVETRDVGLVSVSYYPVRDGKRIRPGMPIQVTPDSVQRARFGGILATVTSVSAAPVTKDGATATVGNAEVVQSLMPQGGYIEVRARLETDSSTPSGYRWSSSRGPETPITEGLTHSTRVTIEGRAPVTYLMPVLREASQIY